MTTPTPDPDTMTAEIHPYPGPAGGWGSVRSLATLLNRSKVPPATLGLLAKQNKVDGFACPSCAWAKPANAHPAEFCENGAKATAWETTSYRADPAFFAAHSVTELLGWRDYDLEMAGRLTHPMRYDAATDHYVPVLWGEAIAAIGATLKATEPKHTVFYASGRASLETSYIYALFARLYGNNNLPDSSNMCHETTSVALKARIGVPVGTCKLEDFDHADAILFFGQNTGSNSPRLLHPLRAAAKRGARIITFNPLRERGLERFTDPQNPIEMALRQETRISSQYLQVKAGGDIAAMTGLAKHLLALDDAKPGVIKRDFIAEHCDGFEVFEAFVRATGWDMIEAESGLARVDLEQAASAYARADRAILVYGMGLTQHVKGVHNVEMLVNLALMRGNIGRQGAGICPVRGHSNVQGQRTVGIAEKPELVPLDRLAAQYGFEPPREKGLNTVEACEGIIAGEVEAFVALGGNFLRAIPDTDRMEAAWRGLKLQVNIATKLNRNHLVMGADNWLLPCIARTEADVQASGRQTVTIEDSTSCIHASTGTKEPASPELRSEAWIVAELAKAVLPPNPKVPWDAWIGDYARIRDSIAETYPDFFHDFNARLGEPGGFYKGNKARELSFATASGKAEFAVPPGLNATGFVDAPDTLRLITLRSNDQFNTTIYGYHDRFRGVKGTRMVLFMAHADMERLGLTEGQTIALEAAAADGLPRRVDGLRVTRYNIPQGCVGGYYPELNPLIAVGHHAEQSFVPAAKSVPVRLISSPLGGEEGARAALRGAGR